MIRHNSRIRSSNNIQYGRFGVLALAVILLVEGVNINAQTDPCANPTIVGTNGNDTIIGTDGDDKIYAKGGNDIICGSNGSDELHGGSGNDIIAGNKDNDKLYGDAGNDTLDEAVTVTIS